MSAERKILMAAVALPAGAIMAMGGLLAGTTAVTPPCTSASPSPSPSASGSPSPAPSGSSAPGLDLTADQWAIVQTTASVATAKGVANTQALTAIFAAGLVESGLQNLPYGDRDSLGVWQERPSAGWGTPAQILDVSYAAGIWFDHMLAVSNWQTMPPGDLAQAVEISAYPDRYAAKVPEAQAIAAAVLGGTVPGCVPASAGGAPGVPTDNIPCAAGTDAGVQMAPGSVPIRLCTVSGVTVNTTLSGPLAQLLAASATAGLHFGGGGFRSEAEQIALRIANHCPDVWTAPPSSCHPPTAIPGTSMHEWGLAIDFTVDGSTIPSHSSPGWIWLNTNAAAFGLQNLPSEPWHWSVNGR